MTQTVTFQEPKQINVNKLSPKKSTLIWSIPKEGINPDDRN